MYDNGNNGYFSKVGPCNVNSWGFFHSLYMEDLTSTYCPQNDDLDTTCAVVGDDDESELIDRWIWT